MRDVPVVGPLYADVISGHNLLVYLAFLCVPLTAWAVYKTRFGLRLRAVGENPAAVDTAGISVPGPALSRGADLRRALRLRRRLSLDRAVGRLRART